MIAQSLYSTLSNTRNSAGIDPGLNITPYNGGFSTLQDPLALDQGRVYSSDPTSQVLDGTLGSVPVYNSLGATKATPVADWTVMVYISSDNLETYAIQDFMEMAAIGSQNGINIVVQFDRSDASRHASPAYDNTSYDNWTDTRRGIVGTGSAPNLGWGYSLGEVNMGDSAALGDFLNWGVSNYQAKNYALVLWGHGNGFGTSIDESGDVLSGSEVASALANLSTDLALVAADSCLMSTIEFTSELSKDAGIFVASQELVSGYGFEYTSIFAGLAANPHWNATEFGSSLIRSYKNYYSQINLSFEETISMIDLKAVNGLVSAIDQFASTVMSSAHSYDIQVLDWFRDYFSNAFGQGDYPSYVDIGKVFSYFVNYANQNPAYMTAAVNTAAQGVLTAYQSAVLENYSAAPDRSTGLSIYFSNKGYYPTSYYTASNLNFAANTQWDEFLNWTGW